MSTEAQEVCGSDRSVALRNRRHAIILTNRSGVYIPKWEIKHSPHSARAPCYLIECPTEYVR